MCRAGKACENFVIVMADQRHAAARAALEGLSVGDAIGQQFSGSHRAHADVRLLPPPPWRWTDDTNMAAGLFAAMSDTGAIDQDVLAATFASTYDAARAYGPNMQYYFRALSSGAHWRDAATRRFDGRGSYGNGAAMRVPPLGAFHAEDLDAAASNARLSAEVTHAHPEAIAGAIAVSVAAAVAASSARGPVPDPPVFLDAVIDSTPTSGVRDAIASAKALGSTTSVAHAARTLGSGHRVSAQDTVPFTLWVVSRNLDDYERAVWEAIDAGGDSDTTSAIIGGIVAARLGADAIPARWRAAREPLPSWIATAP